MSDKITVVELATLVPAGGGITPAEAVDFENRLSSLETPQNVSTADIADLAVTTPKIGDGQVSYAKINPANIGGGAGQLATGDHAHASQEKRGLVTERKSQTAADTASTPNNATWVDAIAHGVALPSGTWKVSIEGGLNLAHDGGLSVDRRAILVTSTGTLEGSHSGATMLTTREHYPVDFEFTGVAGGQTVTAKLQYKGGLGTSGMSSARCPYMRFIAERTA